MVCNAYHDVLPRQLALDFCLTPGEIADRQNHFSVYVPREGRRRFQENREMLLKIASINGKLLFTGREDIVATLRGIYSDTPGDWFFEYGSLRELEEQLRPFGIRPDAVHPFFLPVKKEPVSPEKVHLRYYEQEELESFRDDDRFSDAFGFDPDAPDKLGIAAIRDGQILGMAGASQDSPLLWQIGINVVPSCRQSGIATLLVSLMREWVFERGAVPFYGTALSHILSQRVAARAGFAAAWAEMSTKKIEGSLSGSCQNSSPSGSKAASDRLDPITEAPAAFDPALSNDHDRSTCLY